jgi:hypothetical protein
VLRKGGEWALIINTVNEIGRMRLAGNVARMLERKNANMILVRKPERKRPLGSPRRRWEGNIKMDLREIALGAMDWIYLVQDRNQWRALVNTR